MNGGFRQSMTWLHTWSGIVVCWLLYFMFVTGTLGYFDTEIDSWMQPEIRVAESASVEESITVAQRRLEQIAGDADDWFIYPVRDRERRHLGTFWRYDAQSPNDEVFTERENLSVISGLPLTEARDTGGGQTLYQMHYLLHYLGRAGFYVMAVATMFMFVGLLTGVVAHKKIFADFFTFRWARGQRSWLDLHNLIAVASLPFQFMITYSGLIFTVATLWMPFVAFVGFNFDLSRAANITEEIFGVEQIERAEISAPTVPVANVARQAIAAWGEGQIAFIGVEYPGDANSRITVGRIVEDSFIADTMVFEGATGTLIRTTDGTSNASLDFAATMIGLHEGLFAEPILRWLYFLAGLLGTGMIATGAIYWVIKRKPKTANAHMGLGYRFVENMNVTTIAGLLVAVGAYFWANRLLPIDLENRADWEVHCMFLTWLACFAHAVLRPVRRAWTEQCWLVAAVFLLLPVLNWLTTDTHLGVTLPEGDWVFAGFDLTAFAAGVIAVVAAWKLGGRRTEVATSKAEANDAAVADAGASS